MKRTPVCVIIALVAGLASARGEASQPAYPTKPVRVLVGFGPGGAANILTRILGQRLGDMWNQPVVVNNRPGATTTIAAETAARARPDGYTLLMITSAHAVSAGMYKKLGYDVANWYGLLAPAGTPRPLVEKLHADIVKIVRAPDAADAITKQGAEPETSSPEAFRAYLAAEVAKWAKLVKSSGVQPD